MEWQLPIQKMEIGNIHIGNPWGRNGGPQTQQKPLVPLSYFGTHFRLPFITLLFPPLQIVNYNSTSGRLELDMGVSQLACIKLNTFQETLINAIMYHQQSWFRTEHTKEEIKAGFQPMIENNHILLHCPITSNNVPIYKDGEWKQTFAAGDMKPGQRIRVAIKIHGISFLTRSERSGEQMWGGRCRLQHRIQGVIAQQ
jgi:hypothetical protein